MLKINVSDYPVNSSSPTDQNTTHQALSRDAGLGSNNNLSESLLNDAPGAMLSGGNKDPLILSDILS